MTSWPATTSPRDAEPSPPAVDRRDAFGRFLRILPGALGIGLVIYAYIAGGYLTSVVSFGLIYAIFVTGLNLFMGYTGQVSFGQNAFAAVSGYTSAVLTTAYGWQVLPAFAVGLAGAL